MTPLIKNPTLWRTVTAILLFIALLGPWIYEGVYMPPDAPCTWPNSQPQDHPYCGLAIPGILELIMTIPLVGSLFVDSANRAQWAVDATLHLLLLVSILFPALLLLTRHNHHPLLFILAWSLAATAAIAFLARGYHRPYAPPWGNLLFLAVAFVALILEIFHFLRRKRATPTLTHGASHPT